MTQKELIDSIILRFIDAYLDLNNEIGTPEICKVFSVHRTRASRMIAEYLELYPQNMHYSVKQRKYLKGYLFEKGILVRTGSLTFLNSIEVIYGFKD